jgi:perosamine synthetase
MNPNKIKEITINLPNKLDTIIKKIDKNGLGVLFIVDDLNRLKASITDGDIRRFYLKKKKLPKIINSNSKILNKKPFALPISTNIQNILKYLEPNSIRDTTTLKCIPLVNKGKIIIDVATKENPRNYPVAQPEIGNKELQNVIKSVKSGWISSRGAYIQTFEKKFSDYLRGGFSVSTTSGTTALQLGLSSLGISKNDEVIVPSFTFAGSINSIINCGAKPVIVDIEEDTWTIDLKEIKKALTKKTKAVMIVHIYGQPCRIDEIKKFCKSKKLFLIEDCAEAVGAKYKDRLIGLDGDCSCFSFFANKTITTGEGGMVVFKNKKTADYAKILRNHGMSLIRNYWHNFSGFNYRMTNIQAAIGVAQISRIASLLLKRKKIFNNYDKLLKNFNKVNFLPFNDWSENSYWLYTIILENNNIRDQIVRSLNNIGIEVRPSFYPLNLMPPFKKFAKSKCKISQKIGLRGISLPSTNISFNEQKYIINQLDKALDKK